LRRYIKVVIAELKSGSRHCGAQFKEASVLFIEISDFAALSATLAASELVELLNFVFTTFDHALEAFGSGVYKVETVGPVYVVSAGGVPCIIMLAASFTTF
jgi:class 3 adenylate cyclase